jgi:hypothetical protein
VNLDLRFIEVCPLKEVKPLTDAERAFVMDHLIEPEAISRSSLPRISRYEGWRWFVPRMSRNRK